MTNVDPISTLLPKLQPLGSKITACTTLNPYRRAWDGWSGLDYQFMLSKGEQELRGYYTQGHTLPGAPELPHILTYLATECQRAKICGSAEDWLAMIRRTSPRGQLDRSIAEFEHRYARGLLLRVTSFFGESLTNELIACAPQIAPGPSLAIKPVRKPPRAPTAVTPVLVPPRGTSELGEDFWP